MWELWSEPSWQSSRIWTADGDPFVMYSNIMETLLCDLRDKVGQIIECLFGSEVFQVTSAERYIPERKWLTIISVFQRQYQPFSLLCDLGSVWCIRDSSTFCLSTNVQDHRTDFWIEILIVDKVTLLPGWLCCWSQIFAMINDLIEEEYLLSLVLDSRNEWVVELPWIDATNQKSAYYQKQDCGFLLHDFYDYWK